MDVEMKQTESYGSQNGTIRISKACPDGANHVSKIVNREFCYSLKTDAMVFSSSGENDGASIACRFASN